MLFRSRRRIPQVRRRQGDQRGESQVKRARHPRTAAGGGSGGLRRGRGDQRQEEGTPCIAVISAGIGSNPAAVSRVTARASTASTPPPGIDPAWQSIGSRSQSRVPNALASRRTSPARPPSTEAGEADEDDDGEASSTCHRSPAGGAKGHSLPAQPPPPQPKTHRVRPLMRPLPRVHPLQPPHLPSMLSSPRDSAYY